ncbi:MAG: acyl-homoserine-lactone synthase [Candidatus Sphingomonas phytovorans]|nr:acyl-homoserine-lactone synthase [Sphingomonas sp.]WEK02183.1 MAG: acyl-homoserine-lactone synthase [Sphingomonas sp.]
MLHMVEPFDPAGEREVLRRMFVARKEVFVDLLGWDVPVLDGRYEVDQFDDEHAVYLVVAGRDGRHLASARLLPTTRPHILADLYRTLCDEDPPRGPDIYEVTRFCLDRRIDAAARRDARDRLIAALAGFGAAQGITGYTGVADLAWFRQILGFGWRCRPLGPPRMSDGRMLVALAIEIDGETPRLLAAAGIPAAPPHIGETRDAA